jgi:hypothetical protein
MKMLKVSLSRGVYMHEDAKVKIQSQELIICREEVTSQGRQPLTPPSMTRPEVNSYSADHRKLLLVSLLKDGAWCCEDAGHSYSM